MRSRRASHKKRLVYWVSFFVIAAVVAIYVIGTNGWWGLSDKDGGNTIDKGNSSTAPPINSTPHDTDSESSTDDAPSSEGPSEQERGVSKVVSGMSLDEKIGQMIIAGISGTTVDAQTISLITEYKIGGFIFYKPNLVNVEQTVQLLNDIKSIDQAFPPFLSVDQEGGRVARLPGIVDLPTNKEIGAANSTQLSYDVGVILGKELEAFGFNLNYAPVLDVNSNPDNPVIGDRSFGNNAEVVSELGIQTMKGIQSRNIIPTIKHFPGHGDTAVDSHLDLPIVNKSMSQLEELELIPFKRAIDSGADVVMVAHILLPQLDAEHPASMSRPIMSDLLRKKLAFDGIIITDDMTMGAIIDHFDIGQAAVESIKSGSDIILVGHEYNQIVKTIVAIKDAVQDGEIPEQRINESVSRIIHLKEKYKINDDKIADVNMEVVNEAIKGLFK